MSRFDGRKGILLAGGAGSRLYPATLGVSKHLLSVYDKPMAYYPLSVLMHLGIRQVLLISAREDLPGYRRLFGSGAHLGMDLAYAAQASPGGIAEAFEIGRDFIGGSPVCLVLGDNLFHGPGLPSLLKDAWARNNGATLFAHQVKEPRHFGVVAFDGCGKVLSLEEKPLQPASNYAVTGLYFFDAEVAAIASNLPASPRGEREIIDVLKVYQQQGSLQARILGPGFTWLDAGTPDSLLEAGWMVRDMERRQGIKIACLEEIAWRSGWIDQALLLERAEQLKGTPYGQYLRNILSKPGCLNDSV